MWRFGRRDAFDNRFAERIEPFTGFRGYGNGEATIEPQFLIDLGACGIDIGGGEVDFVDDGDDFEVIFHREIKVSDGLRLHALGCIDEQQDTFAGGQSAGYFVGEVDVSRGIDQVEDVVVSIVGAVGQRDRLAFDRNAAFALDIEVIEYLFAKVSFGDEVCADDEPVGQG